MQTIADALNTLQQQLLEHYDAGEAAYIAGWVMESLTGRKPDLQLWGEAPRYLDANAATLLAQYTRELMACRPVQYVLGESYFYDLKLYVDERVLIPRPETEELAERIIRYACLQPQQDLVVLDIGTGSGCLALTLKKHLPGATVYAADLSDAALAVAAQNAAVLGLDIHLLQADILSPEGRGSLPEPDIIVSNPPYITEGERAAMLPNVLDYEPQEALFVTDGDPLQFYKAIGQFADLKLRPGGSVFLELNGDFAEETASFYRNRGWQTELWRDMQGRYRMLHSRR